MIEQGKNPTSGRWALLVVDMQNGFCHDDGSINRMGLPAARLRGAIEPCVRLVAAARSAGVPVLFARYVYRPDYADGGLLVDELMPGLKTHEALQAGSWDAEVIDALKPEAGEYIVDKNRPSAFFGTDLEANLAALGARNLVVCGVTTNCCVETTVRDASQRDLRTFVVRDAVAEYDDDRHAVALQSMELLFAYVIGLDEALAGWSAAE